MNYFIFILILILIILSFSKGNVLESYDNIHGNNFWNYWNCNSIFIPHLDGLCLVIYYCSLFFKSKKLPLKKKFQDYNYRIKCSFNLFWSRIFIKIITFILKYQSQL